MAGQFDDIIREVLMNYPTSTARVPPDTMTDVNPLTLPDPINTDEEGAVVEPWHIGQGMNDRAVARQFYGVPQEDTKVMLDAIQRRQKLGRNE